MHSTLIENYQTITIKNTYEVEVIDFPSKIKLSDDKLMLIDQIWQEECRKRPLFNGQFLSALSYDGNKLIGAFLPYKFYLAQMRHPDLKAALQIIPVSVSGLTFHGDSVMIGRRGAKVTDYPDYYELSPSGSIDPKCVEEGKVSLNMQIANELFEETGINSRRVKSIRFFSLAYEKKLQQIDLLAEIKVRPFSLQPFSGEYSQLMTIPKNELKEFVKHRKEQFVPLSILMLKMKKLI